MPLRRRPTRRRRGSDAIADTARAPADAPGTASATRRPRSRHASTVARNEPVPRSAPTAARTPELAVVTNDIYTKEDAEALVRSQALGSDRIRGVETGGCPHTAIREDASINLAAVAELRVVFPRLDPVFIESGGDNLAATFSPELADLTLYVIDVAAGEEIPRKGRAGITRSDLLIINKTDLAPLVGSNLGVMERNARRMRGERPFLFANLRAGQGVAEVARSIETAGGLLDA